MPEKMIKAKNEMRRIKTYIQGLDESLEGGIPEGHIVLVCGSAGTMKSSIVFNMLYNEAVRGKVSLYLSLEQSYTSLINHAVNMGFDLSVINLAIINDISKLSEILDEVKATKQGTLVVSDLGAIRKQVKDTQIGPTGDWLNIIKNIVRKLKESADCGLFCLDSMSALYALSKFDNPRARLFQIFEFLRDLNVTSFLISEMPLDKSRFAEYEVEDYLADGIILLELAERQRKVTREISVVKMRATDCNNDVFTLEFKNRQFKVLYGGQPPLL